MLGHAYSNVEIEVGNTVKQANLTFSRARNTGARAGFKNGIENSNPNSALNYPYEKKSDDNYNNILPVHSIDEHPVLVIEEPKDNFNKTAYSRANPIALKNSNEKSALEPPGKHWYVGEGMDEMDSGTNRRPCGRRELLPARRLHARATS